LAAHVHSEHHPAKARPSTYGTAKQANWGEHHSGELRRQTAEAKAERIVAGELGRLGWQEQELSARRKSDPAKLALAARLRETTLSLRAIAARVHLGTSKSANARLHPDSIHA
jgi:hypothetical protein